MERWQQDEERFSDQFAYAEQKALIGWRVLLMTQLIERVVTDSVDPEIRIAVCALRKVRRFVLECPALVVPCDICGSDRFKVCRPLTDPQHCRTWIREALYLLQGEAWHAGGLRELAPRPEAVATARKESSKGAAVEELSRVG